VKSFITLDPGVFHPTTEKTIGGRIRRGRRSGTTRSPKRRRRSRKTAAGTTGGTTPDLTAKITTEEIRSRPRMISGARNTSQIPATAISDQVSIFKNFFSESLTLHVAPNKLECMFTTRFLGWSKIAPLGQAPA
jgi:hypothetical protein